MRRKKKILKRIITFVGSFVAALSVVAQFFPESFAFIGHIPGVDRIVFIVIIVMLMGLFFMNWRQSIEENEEKLRIEHEATHNFAHLIRDTSYEADMIGNGTNNYSSLYHLLKSFTDDVVTCIYKTICAVLNSDITKDNVSVCVKVLDLNEWNNSKITDKTASKYITLSRNYIPKGALQADDAVPHSISEDTAFTRVFAEGKHDWTGINLSKKNNIEIVSEDYLKRKIEYTDSCESWSDYYSNRIVVPIRVKLSEINEKYFQSDERNLFGFICVEIKKPKALRISSKDDEELISVLDLLKTFADTMYVVYDKINDKMESTKESGGDK